MAKSPADIPRGAACAVLIVLLILGSALRFPGLGDRDLGHIEIYTPGIELPPGVSAPYPRRDLWGTIKGVSEEPHPPAWYLLMLPYVQLTGTDLESMRLPSAVVGVACILAIYALGAAVLGRRAGVIAAALLTLNGHHYYWSQTARPYVLACLLGLVTTHLLLKLVRVERHRSAWLAAYLAVALVGLANSYYFWTVMAAHMLWVLAVSWRREGLAGLFRAQLVVVLLATPLIALAIFQTIGRDNYLGSSPAETLEDFFSLGFLFHRYGDDAPAPPLPAVALAALPWLTAALAAVGLLAEKRSEPAPDTAFRGPRAAVVLAAGALAVATIGIGCYLIHRTGRYEGKVGRVTVAAVFPLAGLILTLIDGPSGRLTRALRGLAHRVRGSVSLLTTVAIVPPLIIFAVNMAVPFLAPRHMLIFTPFLLLLVAAGIDRLLGSGIKRALIVGAVLAALLLPTEIASLAFNRDRRSTITDYAGAAGWWTPQIREGDLIFMRRHWVNTPILYYLRYGDHHYVWRRWPEATAAAPDARVWVVTYEGLPMTNSMTEALRGHRRIEGRDFENVSVALYVPSE